MILFTDLKIMIMKNDWKRCIKIEKNTKDYNCLSFDQ
jgi:hypothetical protein